MPKDRHHAASKRDPTHGYSATAPRSVVLPPQVRSSVPQCAQQCLANYINEQYNCSDNDFSCLCERYSSEGFTLGELAYICLNQQCEHDSTTAAKKAYLVCNSDSQAAQPTHSTLTIPATTASPLHTSTGSLRTDTRTTEHGTHHETTLHTKSSTSPPTAETVLSAMGQSRSQALQPSAAAVTTVSSSTTLPTTHLTGAQAAGISIAAMGAVMLAIAATYLIVCFRRRRVTHKDERKSYDFVDEAPPRISPFNYGYADPRGPLGGFQKRRAELTTDKRTTAWPRQSQFGPDNVQRHEKSVDISPDTYRSNDSNRSRLLPDKPFSTLLRPFQKSPALTTMTEFEEDRPQELPPSVPNLKPLPRLPPAGRAIHYPPPPPTKYRTPQYVDQDSRSPEKTRQPSLSLDIPRQAARLPRIPDPVAFPLPPNVAPPPRRNIDSNIDTTSEARESDGSFLNYYASPEAGCDSSPDLDDPTTPIDDVIQRRKAVPNAITITKPSYPPRAIRMDSNGSDTSFESNVSDEPTPPEELDRQLTPVAESPLGAIRYPKIPRSSNQAVPRSPGPPRLSPGPLLSPLRIRRAEIKPLDNRSVLPSQQQPQQRRGERVQPDPMTPQRQGTTSSTLSGSTLAAKRLGNSAAQDLERRLYLADPTHSQANSYATTKASKSEPNSDKSLHHPNERNTKVESPLKGYGRLTSGGRRVSRGQIGSEMKTPGPQLWRSPGFPGQPQEVMMKSPLWEPKLTPSRKGEDLYLSVGLATPMTAAFTPMTDGFAH